MAWVVPFLQDVYYAPEKWIAIDFLRIANIVSYIGGGQMAPSFAS
jgi:hypothetical protein